MGLGDSANQQAEKIIAEQWPRIQEIFQNKVGPTALAAAKNDKALGTIFEQVYKLLPLPVRLVVKKDVFVKYCFANRDKLI